MGLIEDIERKTNEASTPKRCKLGSLIASLSLEEQESVAYALDMVERDAQRPQDERIFTIAWLTGVFNSNGHSIGKTVISDHLRKGCACEQASE